MRGEVTSRPKCDGLLARTSSQSALVCAANLPPRRTKVKFTSNTRDYEEIFTAGEAGAYMQEAKQSPDRTVQALI
jgi:hypothetical protein